MPPSSNCEWTLVIQCHPLEECWKTTCSLPESVCLSDAGEFVAENQISIQISQDDKAKILVAKIDKEQAEVAPLETNRALNELARNRNIFKIMYL